MQKLRLKNHLNSAPCAYASQDSVQHTVSQIVRHTTCAKPYIHGYVSGVLQWFWCQSNILTSGGWEMFPPPQNIETKTIFYVFVDIFWCFSFFYQKKILQQNPENWKLFGFQPPKNINGSGKMVCFYRNISGQNISGFTCPNLTTFRRLRDFKNGRILGSFICILLVERLWDTFPSFSPES